MENEVSHIERLVEQGRYLEARALVETAIQQKPTARLEQLHALTLSKSGMPELAKDVLEKTYLQNQEDAETAGILGGIYKVLFRQTEDSNYAIKSRDTYLKNFTLTGNYYNGINAATMSAIAGQARKGREIATEVIGRVGDGKDLWEVATLGEAYLLSKNYEKAVEYYLKARQLAGTDWGKIGSVYNQLWLIKHYMHVPGDILKIFAPPAVASFIGHMIDHPGRTQPRFPESIQESVKGGIKSAIKSQKIAIGYCSLACGGDIIFAEAMEELGGEVNIFLPFKRDDFVEASVSFAGESWVNRFNSLMDKHPVTYLTQEGYENHSDLFAIQSKVVLGATLMRSAMTHSEAYLVSVLSDYDLTRKEGGTRDNLSLWPFPDKLINISPDNFTTGVVKDAIRTDGTKSQPMISERPALYTLVVDMTTEKEEELQKLFDTVQNKFEDEVVPPLACCIQSNKLIAGFTGMRPLYDIIQILQKSTKIDQKRLRMSISCGPVYISDYHEKDTVQYKAMAGTSVDNILASHQYAIPGECIAFSPIALELTLYNIDRTFVSRVAINDTMVDVYKLMH